MRILTLHSRYALRGGEDQVFEDERNLLRAHGEEVFEFVLDNQTITGASPLATGIRSIWNQEVYRDLRRLIQHLKPQVVTVHNFFPLLSPSIYYAADAEGVPVVQTLHNYRLICPAATLLRDGKICQDCVGKAIALPGIRHACYRGSRVLTAGVTAMSAVHRVLGTWDRMVARYITLTSFMKDRYIAGGFAPDKITVKPNFTEDTGAGNGQRGNYLYVGRLSPEKGVDTLLKAWTIARPDRELRILGTGPEEFNLRAQAAKLPKVTFLGQQPRDVVVQEMGQALAVIVPSIWYEGFGLIVIEAFARGTPVIASDIGGLSSLLKPGVDGFLTPAGDAPELAHFLRSHKELRSMRTSARLAYERNFTPQKNYDLLRAIYDTVLESSPRRARSEKP